MATFETKPNTGTLWVNDRKQNEKQPDRTGTALIGGQWYYVSGWIKDGKNGKFLSLAFKPKDEEAKRPQPARSESADMDVPF
jgi:hypothetical protein